MVAWLSFIIGVLMKTYEKIIQLLKTEGPLTAKILANELGLTTMGVRQHVQGLEDSGDVIFVTIQHLNFYM